MNMDEDMILPDDFEMPTEAEPVEDTTPTEETEVEAPETQEQETQTEQPEQTPFLKVKYNKEEMELDEERARELAQKGLNYDKTIERLQALESDPRLSFIEDLAQQHGMTPDEYIEAVQQQREQSRIDELVSQGISEEVAQELLESRRDREERKKEKEAKQRKKRKTLNLVSFSTTSVKPMAGNMFLIRT
jgi:hypothetical protein